MYGETRLVYVLQPFSPFEKRQVVCLLARSLEVGLSLSEAVDVDGIGPDEVLELILRPS